jgi:hypothetical protein
MPFRREVQSESHGRAEPTFSLAFVTLLCLLTLPATLAQPVSFGFVGGASLLADFQYRAAGDVSIDSTPKGGIVGAMFEVRLPLALSIEGDGLYHPLGFTNVVTQRDGTIQSVSKHPVVTWEFPVFAQYRFTLSLVKPLIELGPTFRLSADRNGSSPSNHGVAIGAGIETRAWRLKIAPVIRYLRWAEDQNVGTLAPFTTPNQVEAALGVFF